MEIKTSEDVKKLDLGQALEALPPRYIHHPFDQVYELSISKKTTHMGVIYFVKYSYTAPNGTEAYAQRQNNDLKVAVKEKLNDLLELGIKLHIK